MKIALLAPLYYPIQEKSDGGIETFLYLLTEELVKRGHQVDLYTVEGSTTSAQQLIVFEKGTDAVSSDPNTRQSREIAGTYKTFKMLKDLENEYDIVHNSQMTFLSHIEAAKLPRAITTLHSPPTYYPILQAIDVDSQALQKNVVAISDFQKEADHIGFVRRIHNGIKIEDYQFNEIGGNYLAWLGRLIPEKAPTEAIRIAKTAQTPIKLAGSKWYEEYYQEFISMTNDSTAQFIGHADRAVKNELLGNAKALIFPSHYEEFGYVRLEAMACGTPVITYDLGPAREIVIDGVTGFVCPPGDESAMASAVKKLNEMPEAEYKKMRQACRQHIEQKFSIQAMTDQYEQLYREISQKEEL